MVQAATDIFHKCMESAIESMSASRGLVSRYLKDEEQVEAMQVLENLTRTYCEMNENFDAVDAELGQGNLLTESDIDNLHNRFLKDLNSPKSPTDYHDNPLWKEVFGESDEVLEVQAKKKDRASDSQHYEQVRGEDSILCSNVFTPPVDPFSKKVIRNPSRNKVCNHVYETNMIEEYINQSRRRAKCPYVGCNNRRLRKSDLLRDDELASQITTYLSQADSDDEL